MKIGLIGCGKVGISIFYLLRRNNQIVGVYDISKKNEKIAAKILNIKKNPSYKELIRESDALFLATPDDAILAAYQKAKVFINRSKYVYHFSGLLPSDILPKTKYIYRASVHPFATFPRIVIPPVRQRFFSSIEGDRMAIKIAKKIFRTKYFTIKEIKKKDKDFYHLIGVFSSNLLVGLISSIYKLAQKINWSEKDIYQMVFPIIEETLNNIKRYSLKNALSGPLQRGDIDVIEKHLRTLKKDKNLYNMYKILSKIILENIVGDNKKTRLKKVLR